jgi:hypothetical protein
MKKNKKISDLKKLAVVNGYNNFKKGITRKTEPEILKFLIESDFSINNISLYFDIEPNNIKFEYMKKWNLENNAIKLYSEKNSYSNNYFIYISLDDSYIIKYI